MAYGFDLGHCALDHIMYNSDSHMPIVNHKRKTILSSYPYRFSHQYLSMHLPLEEKHAKHKIAKYSDIKQ